MKKINIILLRIVLWSILLFVIVIFSYLSVSPSGKVIYSNDFSKDSSFVSGFSPKERFEVLGDSRKIIANPVYFNLFTPREFDKAILNIKYKNIIDERENKRSNRTIEAGILVDKNIWRYNLLPIENKIVDQLSLVWNVQEKDGLKLLQRNKNYNSVDDFLNNLPSRDELALYNYDLATEYILGEYQSTSTQTEIKQAIRGPFQFYTYIKEESLDFSFDVLDINENKDQDRVDVNLYYNDKLIATRRLEDDGVDGDSGEASPLRQLHFYEEALPEGVYKIEFRVNDDIIIDSIKTKQQKVSFVNNIWLYNENNLNFNLYVTGKVLHAKTTFPSSLQTLQIGSSSLEIEETYKQFSKNISSPKKYQAVHFEKDGVILSSDGVFTFNPESLINPKVKKVDNNININAEGINYVLARYEGPKEKNGWKQAKVEFDLRKAYREDGNYSFLISAPSFLLNDNLDNGILVDNIEVVLQGKSWQGILKGNFGL